LNPLLESEDATGGWYAAKSLDRISGLGIYVLDPLIAASASQNIGYINKRP
jgi:hypothetical protein